MLLAIAFFIALLPVGVFCLEVVAGCSSGRRSRTVPLLDSPRVAVLIPAHNEAAGIARTLLAIRSQLTSRDRLVVVADHCTDDTAAIARSQQAEVAERQACPERGKGYALATGLEYLALSPPDVVVFLDADCQPDDGAIAQLALAAQIESRPVQALNLCVPPAGSGPRHILSGLAFRFKNLVRMLGMTRLGGPCYLTGTGMAIPWALVERVPWATGSVVEDMQLGIDFTLAGLTPQFIPHAEIRSEFPVSELGLWQQRRRWEHGFLGVAISQVPRLWGQAIVRGNWPLFVMACDLLVPPLALLAVWMTCLFTLAAGCALAGGGLVPLTMVAVAGVIFVTSFLTGWYVHCRHAAPLHILLQIPRYIVAKLPLYLAFVHRRETRWIRAERSPSS